MYVPPYNALLKALQIDRDYVENVGTVTIPIALFRMLLQFAVASSDFNEETYLKANPDVAEAARRSEVASGFAHYIGFGYFEGRRGGMPFDEKWYKNAYADVTKAISNGEINSAEDHFYAVGGGEGRCPSATENFTAAEWKRALFKKI